jgi:digeranylgeranylglycerophospholipid reductase
MERMARSRSTSPPRVDRESCCSCGGCVGVCPADALTLEESDLRVDARRCDACGICVQFCPVGALVFPEGKPGSAGSAGASADVVVVGAGPAGSVCAMFLARAGLDVLVVEKRQEVGAPKRCAEGISPGVLAEVGIAPDPRWTAARIRKAVIHTPGGGSTVWPMRDEDSPGIVLERKVFDKFLLRDAVRAGARTLIKTTARDVLRTDGRVSGVAIESRGRKAEVRARLVIAADGVDSKIARSAGIPTVVRPDRMMSCVQYEMAGLESVDESEIHLYYGNRIAPGGYAWIFPKGGGTANVGLGIKTRRAGGRTAREFLDGFITARPDLFSKAQALEINCGGVPVRPLDAPLVADGMMIIGDAARMVNPITGAGIKRAMLAGKWAAEAAIESFRKGDLSARGLRAFSERWEREQGRKMRTLFKLQRFAEGLSDDDLDRVAEILSPALFEQMRNGRLGPFAGRVLRKLPHLTSLAVRYLRS